MSNTIKKKILAFLALLQSYLATLQNRSTAHKQPAAKIKKPNLQQETKEYYAQARGWQYDVFDSVCQSRARYQKAFFVAMGLAVLLVLIIMIMMPLKQLVPIVIQQDQNGLTWVSTADFKTQFTHSKEQVKSELYHFITYYESYAASSFNIAHNYVWSMSSPAVYKQYIEQTNEAEHIKELGAKGHRKVLVESIQLINSAQDTSVLQPKNQAIITFKTTDRLFSGQILQEQMWRVIVTWQHLGLPKTPQEQFINYDGFQVIGYQSTALNYPGT